MACLRKVVYSYVVVFFALLQYVESIPDLVKLDAEGKSLTDKFGTIVFDVKNDDTACPKTKFGARNYVNDACAKDLKDFVDVDDFNYFLRPFNKQDSPDAGEVKVRKYYLIGGKFGK